MPQEKTHVWVSLLDRAGKPFLRVRIPRLAFPPLILQWGARFFLRRAGESDYTETDCYFITLDSQYPQEHEQSTPPAPKGS